MTGKHFVKFIPQMKSWVRHWTYFAAACELARVFGDITPSEALRYLHDCRRLPEVCSSDWICMQHRYQPVLFSRFDQRRLSLPSNGAVAPRPILEGDFL